MAFMVIYSTSVVCPGQGQVEEVLPVTRAISMSEAVAALPELPEWESDADTRK